MPENSERESRDVEGCEGKYRVWNDGVVESCTHRTEWQWRAMKGRRCSKYGHLDVGLFRDGGRRHRQVHRLVLEAFVGPCPAGMECRHLDGNPANNRLENLVWGTREENMADRTLHGTSYISYGERNSMAKLAESDVIEIRRLRAGGMTLKCIADKFGVREAAVSSICLGRTWKHIKEGL